MTTRPRSARVLINPAARRAHRIAPHGVLARLREWGLDATLEIPGSADEFATAARRAADDGVDLLVASGGDGTLRIAAGEVAGSRTALAALPAGTANVWAKEAGIPSRWHAAIDAHVLGQRVQVDLGRAGAEPFLLMASAGWDAAIAAAVNPGLKRRLGAAAYMAGAATALPSLRTQGFDITIDDNHVRGDWGMVVIGNTRLYGGLVQFTPDALADDGLLDLVALGPRRPGEGSLLALRLAARRLGKGPAVYRARGKTITIDTPGLAFQLDGDPAGETPVRLSTRRRSLTVSLPPGPLPPIFAPTPPKE